MISSPSTLMMGSLDLTASEKDEGQTVLSVLMPWHMPFLGIVYFMTIHASSIWSSRIHKDSSLLLLEVAVYYSLLQASLLAFLQLFTSLNKITLWTTASHCSLLFSWRIFSLVHAANAKSLQSTLSSTALAASLLIFAFVTGPILVNLKNGIRHGNAELMQAHFLALALSEMCDYAHALIWTAMPE